MKKFLKYFSLLLLIVLLFVGFTTYPKLDILSGFAAKSVASGIFIDNRPLEAIQQGDNDIDLVRLAKIDTDSVAFAGMFKPCLWKIASISWRNRVSRGGKIHS